MLERLRFFFRRLITWFRPDAAQHSAEQPAYPPPPRVRAAYAPPPHEAEPPQPKQEQASAHVEQPAAEQPADDYEEGYNRAQRRALERARRRHDKFVKPKGEPLPAATREPRPSVEREKREKAETEIELPVGYIDNVQAFVDRHQDSGKKVLFYESEVGGQFAFRDTILDQLDRYWIYLDRMKHHDIDAYQHYRHLGSQIVPYYALGKTYEPPCLKPGEMLTAADIQKMQERLYLPELFNEVRPGFGCVAFGADPHTEREELTWSEEPTHRKKKLKLWSPKFLYFLKYSRTPWAVQPIKKGEGDIYKMTIWWDRPHDPSIKGKWGVPQEFCVVISKDGKTIKLLRVLETIIHKVPPKRKHNRHKEAEPTRFPERSWRIPHDFVRWAQSMGLDPQLHLSNLFCYAARIIERGMMSSMIRVAVTKGGMTATFSVDPTRTAYFFKDRDIELTEHGVRRRVFHVVRAHTRKNGAVVKLHFSGAKHFIWAGYDVSISVPGIDHLHLYDWNIGVRDDLDHLPKGERAVYMGEYAAYLARNITLRRGGNAHPEMLDLGQFIQQFRKDNPDARRG